MLFTRIRKKQNEKRTRQYSCLSSKQSIWKKIVTPARKNGTRNNEKTVAQLSHISWHIETTIHKYRCWNFHPWLVTRAHWCVPLPLFYNSVHSFLSIRCCSSIHLVRGRRRKGISFWRIYFQLIHSTASKKETSASYSFAVNVSKIFQHPYSHTLEFTAMMMMIRRSDELFMLLLPVFLFVCQVSQKWMFVILFKKSHSQCWEAMEKDLMVDFPRACSSTKWPTVCNHVEIHVQWISFWIHFQGEIHHEANCCMWKVVELE